MPTQKDLDKAMRTARREAHRLAMKSENARAHFESANRPVVEALIGMLARSLFPWACERPSRGGLQLDGKYAGPVHWSLCHGRPFTRRRRDMSAYKTGEVHQCFTNTFDAVLRHRLIYAEGFVVHRTTGLAHAHAWNVDERGRIVELTLPPRLSRAAYYWGTPFRTAYVADVAKKRGLGVIDDQEGDWPLLADDSLLERAVGSATSGA